MIETLRSYMQLAAGLVESTAEKAKESAEALLTQGAEAPEVLTEQVQGIAEDLIEQGRTNRELLVGLVRTEVERTVGRMGFVREEELAAVLPEVFTSAEFRGGLCSFAPSNSLVIGMRLRRNRMTPLSVSSMSSWVSKT